MVRVDNKIGGMRAPAGALMPSRSGATQNMGSNIKVVIRVRPPNSKELELNSRFVIDVVDEKMLVFDPKQEQLPFFYQGVQQPSRNLLRRANKELKFVFDHVCDQDATNIDVFEKTTKEILTSLMEGYNCSVFVYGATGAGKTFTMIGNQQNPGITYLTMDHLFYSINSFEKDREFEIGVSYIEVYNENVYDLLKPSKTPLQLREDSKYGVMIAGLTLNVIKTAQELLDMLEDGNQNRTQHPTDANAESSRSHAVFQVYITMRYRTTGQVRMVKLSMIDLAGSERASATGCVGERFKEGANINRSLLSLGNCINKLADGGSYIPYRDSKLTRLLKDSLGGNCKTVMIANVSPSSLCFEDTYNTLKYAARANKIQLSCKKNIVNGDIRASQYVKLNEELKKKVKELEAKLALSSLQPVQIVREPDLAKEKATQEWRRRIESAERAHALLESQLLGLMVRQRVLALRHRLRTRAFSHIFDLAHRSSMEAVDKMCTEEIPRHERAAESYLKHSVALDTKVLSAWSKWNDSQVKLESLCEQALAECPDLVDLVNLVKTQSKLRQTEAREELKHKLVYIQNDEINAFCTYTSDMPSMLKKLYFTLKGYDKVPPALTAEYLEIMKKAISAKGITWSDQDSETDNADIHFKFISSLDLEKPSSIPDFNVPTKPKDELNVTVELATTDSDTLTDTENREPNRQSGKKRRGTPIKLPNNDTIIIDDSFEALDATRTMSSAKKVKKDFDTTNDVENAWSAINPDDLNSTFVLAGKMGALQQLVKQEETQSVKKGLTDWTNLMAKSVTFGDNKAKIVKPVVGRALPVRRAGAAPPVSARAAVAPSASARAGFGSSLSRDGTPLQRNVQESVGRGKTNVTQKAVGFKAMRARERVQTHPYSRNNPFGQRR